MNGDVLIAGGGIAGLVAARELLEAGASVTVLEASGRLGGQVASQLVGGVRLDAAAESFAVRERTVLELVDGLGLHDAVVTPRPDPAWVLHGDGTSSQLPATGLLGVPSDPASPAMVAALGRAGADRAAVDASLDPRIGADATSFGALVRARMGQAVVDRLVAPITRGVHSREPDLLAVEAAHPRLRALMLEHGSLAKAVGVIRAASPAGSAVASLRGGMHTLVTALEQRIRELGGEIRLHTRTHAIEPDALTVIDAGGASERLRGTVLRAFAPAGTPTRTIRLVTLLVDADGLDDAPRGTGVLVAADAPGIRARALTHVSAKWDWVRSALPGAHVLRLSYDAALGDPAEYAVQDAAAILGIPVRAVAEPTTIAWRRSGLSAVASDVIGIGEAAAGTGLAAVVGQARNAAATLVRTEQVSVAVGAGGDLR